MDRIAFIQSDATQYPDSEFNYSPAENYPEYPFGSDLLSKNKNDVYSAIREGFKFLEWDIENYGAESWNPLGRIITPGQTVLIKPNWVSSPLDNQGYEDYVSVVTHGSIIRAVLDYVYIASKGMCRVVVADSPTRQGSFSSLHEKMYYNKIWEFFRKAGFNIDVLDLRGFKTENQFGEPTELDCAAIGELVDLGKESSHDTLTEQEMVKLRLTGYPKSIMQLHHLPGKHEYLISKEILGADVIINLPKVKTHKIAGMTACAKNLIGINVRKEYLPHHRFGPAKVGGDEYQGHSFLTGLRSKYNDFRYKKNNIPPYLSKVYHYISGLLLLAKKFFSNEPYRDGWWYGNDTIWRTVVDMNTIIHRVDKEGTLCKEQQRTVFNVCDMIVAGEKEGPMHPDPKHIGAIVMGESIAATDYFICRVMGFNPKAIRYIKPLLEQSYTSISEIEIAGKNGETYTFDEFPYRDEWHFVPSAGYLGHVEAK